MEIVKIIIKKAPHLIFFVVLGLVSAASVTHAAWVTSVWNEPNDWIINGVSIDAQKMAENFEYLKAKIDILKAGTLTNVYAYSTPGVYAWDKPNRPDISSVQIECWGAGGGGGAGNNRNPDWASSGGGGGGYFKDTINFDSMSSSIAVVVGAGGIGGPSRTVSGTAGGDSSIGGLISVASGGGGGTKNAGGTGGIGSTQNGEQGVIRGGGTKGNGGAGGDSQDGAGGAGGMFGSSNGQDGVAAGGGGGGGAARGGSLKGGDGASGKCRIELFE